MLLCKGRGWRESSLAVFFLCALPGKLCQTPQSWEIQMLPFPCACAESTFWQVNLSSARFKELIGSVFGPSARSLLLASPLLRGDLQRQQRSCRAPEGL